LAAVAGVMAAEAEVQAAVEEVTEVAVGEEAPESP